MAVLYEHWRNDLNECFYVGISWSQEDKRPYDMYGREKNHLKVQEELKEKGLFPEIRIQATIDWMTKEELGELERSQIKYWKDLIGDRLTNISPGGYGYIHSWTAEEKAAQSKKLKEARAKPALKELTRKTALELWQTPKYRNKVLSARAKTMATEEYKQKQKNISLKVWSDEKLIMRHRQVVTKAWEDSELRRAQKIKSISNWRSEEIRNRRVRGLNRPEVIKNNKLKSFEKWQKPEYRVKMMLHAWWLINVQHQKYWGA